MKEWKFDVIIVLIWFLGLLVIGVLISSIIAVILYFLLRDACVNKIEGEKKIIERYSSADLINRDVLPKDAKMEKDEEGWYAYIYEKK